MIVNYQKIIIIHNNIEKKYFWFVCVYLVFCLEKLCVPIYNFVL